MFGIEHWGVEPEIMTMAKGIANGMPLAVTTAVPEIADAFQKLTISTFGGNPISCAAANTTLEVIETEDLVGNSERMGQRLEEGLRKLQTQHPRVIGDVRGKGLMLAIELVKDEEGGDRTPNPEANGLLFEETKKRGLLIGKGGLYGNVVRITPALTVGENEIDQALRVFGEAFTAMEGAGG